MLHRFSLEPPLHRSQIGSVPKTDLNTNILFLFESIHLFYLSQLTCKLQSVLRKISDVNEALWRRFFFSPGKIDASDLKPSISFLIAVCGPVKSLARIDPRHFEMLVARLPATHARASPSMSASGAQARRGAPPRDAGTISRLRPAVRQGEARRLHPGRTLRDASQRSLRRSPHEVQEDRSRAKSMRAAPA